MLSGDLFPGPVAEGSVYRLQVADGTVSRSERDWERTVRQVAPGVDADQFVVPLRNAREHVPETLASPATAVIDSEKSLLVTGEPGAGKTEAIKLLLPQLSTEAETATVVFSYKDDYTEWASGRDDVVQLSTRGSTHVYNVFDEVDGTMSKKTRRKTFDEIARVLFKRRREQSKHPFFEDAAAELLSAMLRYLYREAKRAGLPADNRELVDFVRRLDREKIHALLTETDEDGEHRYPDFVGAASHITPDTHKQAAGVYSTLRLLVESTFGNGDFSRPTESNPSTAIREYMNDPAGRVLLLDFPIEEAELVRPMFRFFLQRAIKRGLADDDQRSFYVLDEFARIPDVDNIKRLVDTGRAQNAQAILGLQSMSQLFAKYGQFDGESMNSGLLYELHLRSGDRRTVEYVRHRLGGRATLSHVDSDDGHGSESTVSTPARTALLQQLADGEGFLVTPRGYARVWLPMYSQLSPATRRALVRHGQKQTCSAAGDRAVPRR